MLVRIRALDAARMLGFENVQEGQSFWSLVGMGLRMFHR
jgi:hypothetical protein